MTVETQNNRIVYPADGVTVDFAFNFKTDDVNTIKVYEDAIVSLSTIVITLNPNQELTPGGNVNITPAIAAPIVITITREEDFLQLTKYPVGGDFPSASHEKALDKGAKLTQQIDDKFVRSIRADINEPLAGVSLVIPNAADRKSTFLGFDGFGNAIASPGGPGTVPISLFMTPVVSSANAEAARLLLETMAGFKYIPVAGTDTYTSVNIPAHTSYVTDAVYFGDFVNPNVITSPTWDIDGLGPVNIVSKNGSLLTSDELGGSHFLLYDGTNFRLLNPVQLPLTLAWTSPQQVGNPLSLTNTSIGTAHLTGGDIVQNGSGGNNQMRAYRFDGDSWAVLGNTANAGTINATGLGALNTTDVVRVGQTFLEALRFDGTDWAVIGNVLTVALSSPNLAVLNATDIAVASKTGALQTYRFDGTDWATLGNPLGISGAGELTLTALNATDIALIQGANGDLETYRFDGADWVQIGNTLVIGNSGVKSATALNRTDVSYTDTANDLLETYHFDGVDWSLVGTSLALASGGFAHVAINGTDVALVDNTSNLATYRHGFSIGAGPYKP